MLPNGTVNWYSEDMTLTIEQAYDKGWLSQRTQSDWDVALERFSRRYCAPHPARQMCAFEHAWADGWDDHQEDAVKYTRLAVRMGGSQ